MMWLGARLKVLAIDRTVAPSRIISISVARSSGFKWLYDFPFQDPASVGAVLVLEPAMSIATSGQRIVRTVIDMYRILSF